MAIAAMPALIMYRGPCLKQAGASQLSRRCRNAENANSVTAKPAAAPKVVPSNSPALSRLCVLRRLSPMTALLLLSKTTERRCRLAVSGYRWLRMGINMLTVPVDSMIKHSKLSASSCNGSSKRWYALRLTMPLSVRIKKLIKPSSLAERRLVEKVRREEAPNSCTRARLFTSAAARKMPKSEFKVLSALFCQEIQCELNMIARAYYSGA